MLSTIIVPPSARGDGRASCVPLVRTLAALVPATVAGTIRDVTVLLVGRSPEAVAIADEAGCLLVESEDFGDAMRQALASARASWVLVLKAGAAPSRDFGDDVADALEGAATPPSALMLREDQAGWRRVLPSFAPVAGVIVPRHVLTNGRFRDFADVRRRVGSARTLPTRVALVRP